MSLPSLATVDELHRFLDDEDVADDRAQQALDNASAIIRTQTRQTLTEVLGDTIKLTGSGSPLLLLPELPVAAVSEVAIQGTTLDTTRYEWSGRGLLRCQRDYIWPSYLDGIEVTYDHGYHDLPGDLTWLALSVAARMVIGSAALQSETIGSYIVAYRSPGWTVEERAVLERYRVTW